MTHQKDIKIILSGLDNAGKSSMLVGLRRMYGFEDVVDKLKPTIRIDYYHRKFLNLKLSFFDMGGQKKFRDSYLSRPIYFEAVNILIYLIDIQDELRIDQSVEYLGNVIKILSENDYNKAMPIYVCFSKSDYKYVKGNRPEYFNRVKMVKDLIQKTYSDFTFNYYSTSIFNLYTIVNMISDGLHSYMEYYSDIRDIIYKFGDQTGLKQIILFDHTGLVISNYFKGDGDGDGEGLEIQNKIDEIISSHLSFFGQLEDQNLDVLSSRGIEGDLMNCCYQFHLYKTLEEDSPYAKEEIEELKGEKNPKFANYYLSVISNLKNSIDIENGIPSLLGDLRTVMNKIIENIVELDDDK